MEKKGMIGIVLALLVVIFLGIALIGTWYTMTTSGTVMGVTGETKADYGLQEGRVKTDVAGVVSEVTGKWADAPASNTKTVYTNTFYITIVALVVGIIWLITALLTGIGKLKLSAKIVAIFMLLTMIFAIAAPGYFAATLPGAMNTGKGFMGSEDVAGVKTSWGPGYGWYLAVVAFVLALIGLILVLLLKKKAPAAAP